MAPSVGFEPTAIRLTAKSSTVELTRQEGGRSWQHFSTLINLLSSHMLRIICIYIPLVTNKAVGGTLNTEYSRSRWRYSLRTVIVSIWILTQRFDETDCLPPSFEESVSPCYGIQSCRSLRGSSLLWTACAYLRFALPHDHPTSKALLVTGSHLYTAS